MVRQIENFFGDDLYEELLSYAYEVVKKEDSQFRTNRCWFDYVISPQPVLNYPLKQDPIMYDKLATYIEERLEHKIDNQRLFIYYWPQYSYIPWHYDGHGATAALSVYMNPEWDRNNGGYFCYKDGEEIKAIVPQKNFAVFNDSVTEHSTTAVNCEMFRISIQAFVLL